jgi:hypothetical protein
MLYQDAVFEHGYLRALPGLAHRHDAVNRLTACEELGFGQDWGATTTGLATLSAPLLLGLQARRPTERPDIVTFGTWLADANDRVRRVVRERFGIATATTPAAPARCPGTLVVVPEVTICLAVLVITITEFAVLLPLACISTIGVTATAPPTTAPAATPASAGALLVIGIIVCVTFPRAVLVALDSGCGGLRHPLAGGGCGFSRLEDWRDECGASSGCRLLIGLDSAGSGRPPTGALGCLDRLIATVRSVSSHGFSRWSGRSRGGSAPAGGSGFLSCRGVSLIVDHGVALLHAPAHYGGQIGWMSPVVRPASLGWWPVRSDWFVARHSGHRKLFGVRDSSG